MEARVQDATIVGNMGTTPGNARIPKEEEKEKRIRKEGKEDSKEHAICVECGDTLLGFALRVQGKEEEEDRCHFHGIATIAA